MQRDGIGGPRRPRRRGQEGHRDSSRRWPGRGGSRCAYLSAGWHTSPSLGKLCADFSCPHLQIPKPSAVMSIWKLSHTKSLILDGAVPAAASAPFGASSFSSLLSATAGSVSCSPGAGHSIGRALGGGFASGSFAKQFSLLPIVEAGQRGQIVVYVSQLTPRIRSAYAGGESPNNNREVWLLPMRPRTKSV